MNFNPENWYWLADDGRVYGTKNQRIVDSHDADYSEWINKGMSPTPWPRDLEGNQTEDELQATLAPYQTFFVGLKAYAASKRWEKEQGGIVFAGVPIATDDRSKQMIMGARIAADSNSNFSTKWVGKNGQIQNLNSTSVIALSDAILAHVANCFAIFSNVCEGIDNESIIDRYQIDSAFGEI